MKSAKADEVIAWLKILENILAIADPTKLESPTSGEWRPQIARCLLSLLHSPGELHYTRKNGIIDESYSVHEGYLHVLSPGPIASKPSTRST